MATQRETTKRLKAIGLPIELCVKYERALNVKPGETPTYVQKIFISEAMISALEAGVRNIQLTPEDYELIAKEVRENETKRNGSHAKKGTGKDE